MRSQDESQDAHVAAALACWWVRCHDDVDVPGDSDGFGYRAVLLTMNRPMKTYSPPLTTNPHGPLYRVDKAIVAAQLRLDAAIDAKRHHTSQNLAHEVIKEAREGLKKAEQARLLKIKEVALKAAESETDSER